MRATAIKLGTQFATLKTDHDTLSYKQRQDPIIPAGNPQLPLQKLLFQNFNWPSTTDQKLAKHLWLGKIQIHVILFSQVILTLVDIIAILTLIPSDDWSYEILQVMGPLLHTMVVDERNGELSWVTIRRNKRYIITSPGSWVGMRYLIRPRVSSLRSKISNFKFLSQSTRYIQIFTWTILTCFSSKITCFLLPDLAFRAQNQPLSIVRSLHPPCNYSLQSTSIKSC